MNIAIIDDEEKWQKDIRSCVMQYFQNKLVMVGVYSSGTEFIEKNQAYDIVFVDIEMPKLDGFKTIVHYYKKFPEAVIIILTTHTELSRKGYTVNAFRYIDKLKMTEEIKEALEGAEQKLKNHKNISISVVNVGDVEIAVKDILYIETEKRNLLAHTKNGMYRINNTITQLEDMLSEYGFYRCHKSYLVNLGQIMDIVKDKVIMSDGSTFFASVRKYTELKQKYLDWCCRNANK